MNIKFSVVALLICAFGLSAIDAAVAKPAPPKTVLDYFLLLPKQSYFALPLSGAERRAYLKDKRAVVDLKNDYILFPGDGAQGTLEFALFRFKGRVTVVIRDDFEEGRLDFLRYENGRWKDVTKAMMPTPYNARYDYHVPRRGTTIQVTAGRRYYRDPKPSPNRGKKVCDLVWSGGKFKVKR